MRAAASPFVSLLLQLPAWILIGGWLVGQPAAAQDTLAFSAESPETVETVADSLLIRRLQTILSAIDAFSGVTVSVTEGVVRLDGTVVEPDARRRVEELASSLEGVVYVVNDVEASTDVETRITPAVTKLQEYWDGFVSQLPVLAVALIVVLLFWLAAFSLGRWSRPASWTGINPLVWGFVSRLVRGVFLAVGLLLAFDILGITSLMGAVLGTAGIVGLALGFAFQDIVENYLAGMLLSLRRPFSVNDLVRIGEFEGKIVRLTSRELILLSLDGNHVRLPNAHVFKNPLINYTINPRRLFMFDVGIGVQEDLQRVMSIGVDTLVAMKGVMEEPPPFARVMELDASSVRIRYHGWVDQRHADFFKVQSEAIRLVKAALDDASIDMPETVFRVLTAPLSEQASRPSRQESDVEREARHIDVEPDRRIDEEVLHDLRTSEDENLLG